MWVLDDLINLFEKELSNDIFRSILKLYPKEIKENLDKYLILSKISLKIRRDELNAFFSKLILQDRISG